MYKYKIKLYTIGKLPYYFQFTDVATETGKLINLLTS